MWPGHCVFSSHALTPRLSPSPPSETPPSWRAPRMPALACTLADVPGVPLLFLPAPAPTGPALRALPVPRRVTVRGLTQEGVILSPFWRSRCLQGCAPLKVQGRNLSWVPLQFLVVPPACGSFSPIFLECVSVSSSHGIFFHKDTIPIELGAHPPPV